MGRHTLRERQEKIKELKEAYKLFEEMVYNKDQYGNGFEYSIPLEIKLLTYNIPYEDHQHGFLLDGRFIIAVRKSKWCNPKKYKWYWYSNLKKLCEKLEIDYETDTFTWEKDVVNEQTT
jgi:hypothetical protein